MFNSSTVHALVVGLLMLRSGFLFAQAPQVDPVTFSFDGGGIHQSESDLKDADGSFDVDRWFVGVGVDYNWDFRNAIGIRIGGGRSIYSFDDETGFGGGAPWSTAEDFRTSAPARFKVSERATAIVVPTVRWNKEKGAGSGDSTSYGLFAAVAWRLSPDLTIGPGFGVFSRLGGGTRFFPAVAIDWDISDRWNLGTGSGLAATSGPGLTLSYKASEYWTYALAGRYENLEFRLNDEAAAPEGIGQDKSFPLVLSATVEPNKKTSFSLFAGVDLGGEFKLKDTFGDTIEKAKYDPAPILGVTFSLGF